MDRHKGRPKGLPKTGGRKKGQLNKLTIGRKMVEARAIAVDPDGPGHAYEGLWWLARQYRAQLQVEAERGIPDLDRLVAAQERLGRTLRELVQYERPKLKSVTLKGDPENPLRVKADLTVLTDAELDLLEKLCLKAGAGHTGGSGRDTADPNPGRAIPAPRAGRAR